MNARTVSTDACISQQSVINWTRRNLTTKFFENLYEKSSMSSWYNAHEVYAIRNAWSWPKYAFLTHLIFGTYDEILVPNSQVL